MNLFAVLLAAHSSISYSSKTFHEANISQQQFSPASCSWGSFLTSKVARIIPSSVTKYVLLGDVGKWKLPSRAWGTGITIHRGSRLLAMADSTASQVKVMAEIGGDGNSEQHRFLAPRHPTLLLSVSNEPSVGSIMATINTFYENDDVFCDDFLTDTLIIQHMSGDQAGVPYGLWTELSRKKESGEWRPNYIVQIAPEPALPQGPYFLTSDHRLLQAWRLYPDTHDAFATTFVPVSGSLSQSVLPRCPAITLIYPYECIF